MAQVLEACGLRKRGYVCCVKISLTWGLLPTMWLLFSLALEVLATHTGCHYARLLSRQSSGGELGGGGETVVHAGVSQVVVEVLDGALACTDAQQLVKDDLLVDHQHIWCTHMNSKICSLLPCFTSQGSLQTLLMTCWTVEALEQQAKLQQTIFVCRSELPSTELPRLRATQDEGQDVRIDRSPLHSMAEPTHL